MLSTNDCAMPLLKIATLLDTSSTTTVNFIREVSQAQHVYFITINGVAIMRRRSSDLAKDGRIFNGTDEKRGGGEEDVES